jgi:hypothetical protein
LRYPFIKWHWQSLYGHDFKKNCRNVVKNQRPEWVNISQLSRFLASGY